MVNSDNDKENREDMTKASGEIFRPTVVVIGTGMNKDDARLKEIVLKFQERGETVQVVNTMGEALDFQNALRSGVQEIVAPFEKLAVMDMPYIPREKTYDHKRKYGRQR